MSTYVGIVRSDLRLRRAWERLDLLYEETEDLFKRVKATKDIEQSRFTATRRAHDTHKLALTNVERHTLQSMHFLTTDDKRPLEVLNLDDGLPFTHDHF